ncbi:hypothetical protein ILYODFUR_023780 [Ilyodon furcidens]|uniref:Uncharacterized protein n=1 Tax=Ilyodon furcidens TaxID=33524 RepID=A0ABV0U9R5_9TELE
MPTSVKSDLGEISTKVKVQSTKEFQWSSYLFGVTVAQMVGVCPVASSNLRSVRLSRCVLGQDTSPAMPADGGQRDRWDQALPGMAVCRKCSPASFCLSRYGPP